MRVRELPLGSRAKRCLQVMGGVSAALGALIAAATPGLAQGMALSGKFAVSPTGAATYAIPIALPPGTAGMLPSLSLTYSSQNGNGLVGVGWALEGLVSISRCPRSIAQDGVRGTIAYDGNDRFCLDGQRLVAISGAYGANGTEYRTEIESFVKVVSFGSSGSGPQWFQVRTKAGQILEFGNTSDSRPLVQGTATVRSWAVNKVSDTKGNYFAVTYVNDAVNGQLYPSRIDYTGNAGAGLAPYNSVRFLFNTARPDAVPAYHAGALFKTTVLLTNVQTFTGEALVSDYRLTYGQGTNTGRSQLTSITLCDASNICLPATTLAWQNGTSTPTVIGNPGGADGVFVGRRIYPGDFNGDGRTDLLWDTEQNSPARSTGTRIMWTSTVNGSFAIDGNVAGQDGQLVNYAPILGDFNRDGRTDIWWYEMNGDGLAVYSYNFENHIRRWSGSASGGFTIAAGPPPPNWQRLALVADANGDGRTDILWSFVSYLVAADGNAVASTHNVHFHNRSYAGTDFNGDGVTDILIAPSSGKGLQAVYLGNGDGTFTEIAGSYDSSVNSYLSYLADVNGDGNTDIIWDLVDSNSRSNGTRLLWLSKGNGTFEKSSNLGGLNGTLVGYRPYFGDFNGDGKADLLWDQVDTSSRSLGARVMWLGKGDGTFTVIPNFGAQDGTLVSYRGILGDFNGDGKTDVFWDRPTSSSDSRSGGQRVLWLSDYAATDLMDHVTNGMGADIAISYQPLTNSSIYTKENTAVDPIVDLQGAMYVVSHVAASNGLGGVASSTYHYVGGKADQDGRGFLGFRQVKATDLQTGIVHTTTYRQDFPFTSIVASETKTLGGQTLNQTTNHHHWSWLGAGHLQVRLAQTQSSSADLNGTAMPTVTSSYQYDGFGNATKIEVSATDGHAKTTSNSYSNDTSNWVLGRLTGATVTSLVTQPGSPPGPTPPGVDVNITSSSNNFNLWNYLVAKGLATPGTPGTWRVAIASNVIIGSASRANPAFDTGVFPAGSTVTLTNYGAIVGAGGKGRRDAYCQWCGDECSSCYPAIPAESGGPALRAQSPVVVANHGRVWGGGGGGSNGGGGGAGVVPGAPAWPGLPAATMTEGGKIPGDPELGTLPRPSGGGPGQPGQTGCDSQPTEPPSCIDIPGGAAGTAVIGISFITWSDAGDRRGPVN